MDLRTACKIVNLCFDLKIKKHIKNFKNKIVDRQTITQYECRIGIHNYKKYKYLVIYKEHKLSISNFNIVCIYIFFIIITVNY